MNPFSTILVFGQAIGFKLQALTDRRLQEAGASPFSTFALQRFALIPAVIWSIVFVRPHDITQILHSTVLLAYFLLLAIIWNVQSFLSSYVMNTMSSMSGLASLEYLIYFPLLLLVGTFFNHDIPNLYSIAGIAILLCAFVLQPSQHSENIRNRFSMPVTMVIGFLLLRSTLDATNVGITRALLGMVRPEVFLGVFAVITIGFCMLWTSFVPKRPQDARVLKQQKAFAIVIPLLWFAASIPETFAYAALPIYTVVSIGAVTFAFDSISDLFRHRIRMSWQTTLFILLVLAGTALAILSI
ncbi:MAG: hypothetical protein JWN49_324 [Parcubacteria group bacterium]|nr:hypothetical protein [Parcubacteria group bacterium]